MTLKEIRKISVWQYPAEFYESKFCSLMKSFVASFPSNYLFNSLEDQGNTQLLYFLFTFFSHSIFPTYSIPTGGNDGKQ